MNSIPIKIRNLLKYHKIKVSRKSGILIISVQINKTTNDSDYQNILYTILNRYEREYFITIRGIPYCFLPEAVEHISYPSKHIREFKKNSSCIQCRFNISCPGLPLSYKKIHPPVPDTPKEIAIEAVSFCNLSCKHCFHTMNNEQVILAFSKIKKILGEAKKIGIKTIRFTGGEPLLHPEIINILKFTKTQGFNVCLNTNATLLNDKNLNIIQRYIDNILVSICTDSYKDENNKSLYWNMAKQKLIILRKLIHSRIKIVRIGTVISKELITNFNKYACLILASGVKTWELYRPMLPDSILKTNPTYNISASELRITARLAVSLRKKNIHAYIGNAVPFCIFGNIRLPFMVGSQFEDGNNRLVLDSKGHFKPSYCINMELGYNILDAWSHPFIRAINSGDNITGACKECVYFSWCRGGSRFMANESHGEYFTADPLQTK